MVLKTVFKFQFTYILIILSHNQIMFKSGLELNRIHLKTTLCPKGTQMWVSQ
jgi:hypothetical protein